MLISSLYPTKYLTAADLDGKAFTLTIRDVTLEEMKTHDNKMVQKPVAWFERAQRGFVLNATNARIIAALYGDNTENWRGCRITIYATRVKAFGSNVDAIRVKEEVPAQPKPASKTAQVEVVSGLDDLDEVTDYNADEDMPDFHFESDEAA
jgi:hypothetical protein